MRAWLLPVATGAFWTGILVQGLPNGGPSKVASVLILVAGLAVVAAILVPKARVLLGWSVWLSIAVSFALLGLGWSGLQSAFVRTSPMARMAGASVTLLGEVASPPESGDYGWTATVDVDLVVPRPATSSRGARRVSHPVWVEGTGAPPKLPFGERVQLEGVLSPLRGSFGRCLGHRGYPATLSADRVLDRGPPGSQLRRMANGLRAALGRSLQRVLPPRDAGLLMGLALGDTSRLDPGIDQSFRASGLSHLTAVSGENLAMFMAPILGLAMLVRLGRTARLVVGGSSVIFFVLLAGAEPSVLRAAAMAGLTLLAVFFGRPRSSPAILAGAVLLLLAKDPTLVYSIGFRLSVGATGGIALLAGPVAERLSWLPKGLAVAAGTTIAAQTGVTPLLLYHFGVVPLVSIPANILAFPAVGPAMLLGLLAAGAGTVSHPLGLIVGGASRVPLGYLEGLAERMARSPLPSITSAGGKLGELLVGMVLVAVIAWWIRSGARPGRKAVVAVLVVVPLFVWSGALRAGAPRSPVVVFFDVGQGDASLIRSPAGASILIDGGPDPELVARKLAALGIRRLDLMVATHPHADHVAGLPEVLARFAVGLVLDPGCRDESPAYAAFLSAVRSSGVAFRHPRAGASFRVGDVSLQALGPERCYRGTSSDANNDSVVLRVTVATAVLLFPGDAEQSSQADLLSDGSELLRATVLKVPHHGGATSTASFFRAVQAQVAIVSVGPNRYGHPKREVLDELRREGMKVIRTDRSGDITLSFRGEDVLVETSS